MKLNFNNLMDVQQLIVNAKKTYNLCEYTFSSITTINTPRIFSFSLFILDSLVQIRLKQLNNVPLKQEEEDKLNAWLQKYLITQVNSFEALLNNADWNDFGIAWFIEEKIFNLFQQEFNEIYTRFNKYIGRMLIISYNCGVDVVDPFYGTLVRYTPLVLGYFEVVLFRDSHMTMPNGNNNYDRSWYETWLTTDKQFWLYQGIFYNPDHSAGRRVPFAATWGSKIMHGGPMFSSQYWNQYFGNIDLMNINSGYGVDEKIFGDLVENTNFLDNSYIVGVSWIIYLFASLANPRNFTRLNHNNQVYLCKPKDIHSSIFVHTYFTEIRCIIYYIAENFNSGKNTIISDLWNTIDDLHKTLPSNTPTEQLLKDLVSLTPTSRHLWEFLFAGDYINQTVENIITMFPNGGIDYDNMCKIIPKYLVGGEFYYDDYEKLPHKPLPTNIKLPENYV